MKMEEYTNFTAPQCFNINLDNLNVEEIKITYQGMEYDIDIQKLLNLVGKPNYNKFYSERESF